ncbi:SET domain-containing protein [Gloeophyllum trabeum ATCC 11539]|uniref:SET domain-containing protein n=1 Tax=Gloeophyllum trabeum (strain ATCC 11539 / FP-39264 / Madison 617) TaxID=670483 RepID=S7Q402_GLOTA|nr:SET domain-containing protein [Gloeophyllum trabeum ATCC 11539]EPQ54746.1 SET domain-containing protein [Gloeophyllum trabeum ATCC 11539]
MKTRMRAPKRPASRVRGQYAREPRSNFVSGNRLALLCLCIAILFGVLWTPSPIPNAPASPPFEVVDLPGRGKGLVATRDIKRGDLLIREAPLLRIPQQITSSPTALLSSLLSALPAASLSAFFALSAVHLPSSPDPDPLDVALAIVQTNAVAAGEGHIGVFPTMARLNHACAGAFNAVYSWRAGEGVLVVHAVRDVRRGEELLTTYMDTKRKREDRRAYLLGQYAFNCTCATCSLAPALSAQSDARLEEMAALYSQFASWGGGAIDGRAAADIARRIWALGEAEGYVSERGRLAGDVVWVAAAHSDVEALRAWGALAEEWYGYELGRESAEVRGVREAVARPAGHAAWGTRPGMAIGGGP